VSINAATRNTPCHAAMYWLLSACQLYSYDMLHHMCLQLRLVMRTYMFTYMGSCPGATLLVTVSLAGCVAAGDTTCLCHAAAVAEHKPSV
jgi:hypothetical protein